MEKKLTAAELIDQEILNKETTTMVLPAKVDILVDHDTKKSYGPGICEIPNSLKDHYFLKAHGAKEYDETQASKKVDSSATNAEAEAILAVARTKAETILTDANAAATQLMADAQAAMEAHMAQFKALTVAEAELTIAEAMGDKKRIKAAKEAVDALKE